MPSVRFYTRRKKNQSFEMAEMTFPDRRGSLVINLNRGEAIWLSEKLPEISVSNPEPTTFGDLEQSFNDHTGDDFILFWNSPSLRPLRAGGLLML